MAQLVLSGGLFEISGQKVLEIVSWIDPSRWGFAAAASTTDLLNFPFKDRSGAHGRQLVAGRRSSCSCRSSSWWSPPASRCAASSPAAADLPRLRHNFTEVAARGAARRRPRLPRVVAMRGDDKRSGQGNGRAPSRVPGRS